MKIKLVFFEDKYLSLHITILTPECHVCDENQGLYAKAKDIQCMQQWAEKI